MIGKSCSCLDSDADDTKWYALADAIVVSAVNETINITMKNFATNKTSLKHSKIVTFTIKRTISWCQFDSTIDHSNDFKYTWCFHI